MAHRSEIDRFVHHALAQGASPAEVSASLQEAGWAMSEITPALGRWHGVALGAPVPRPGATAQARDFFFYALLFGLLLFGAIHLVLLLNVLVDWVFEAGSTRFARRVSWPMAAVVVIGPLFFWLAARDHRRAASDAALRRSVFRRWMTYIAMLGAAASMIGSAVAAVYGLLDGDFTAQFACKIAVVLGVSALVFAYARQIARSGEAE